MGCFGTESPATRPHCFTRRGRVAGTLFLALLAAGAQLCHAMSGGSVLPPFILLALLCNAAGWEAWQPLRGGHKTEFIATLLFPWVMLFALRFTAEPTAEFVPTPVGNAPELARHYGASFACWAMLALILLLRDGIRLRGLGIAATQQAVCGGMLFFLYPVGFLGVGMNAALSICSLVCAYLLYRLFKTLAGNVYAALALTLLLTLGLDYACTALHGSMKYGLVIVLQAEGQQAAFYGGAYIIIAALLMPAIKFVKFFRAKFGGGESPLPVLGFLGDILAVPALPCALIAMLILGSWMLCGAGAALSF